MTWGKSERRPVKQIGGDIGPRRVAPSIGLAEAMSAATKEPMRQAARVPAYPLAEDKQGRKIRESARGEECDIRIPLACNFDSATTVWSHFPGLAGGRGMGLKSLDLCGVYACSACHDIADDRADPPHGMTRQDVMLCWHEGHLRSILKLRSKGLV